MSNIWNDFEEEIRKYCNYLSIEDFNYAINISLRYQYLFTETPKVACSTIKNTLQLIELNYPDNNWDDERYIHNRNFSPLLKPSQVGKFENYLIKQNPFKFCFVRNPYSRLLSAYLDKICRNRPQKIEILKYMSNRPSQLDQNVSFNDFITVICEQSISEMDPHWRIQYYQSLHDALSYDFIGRLENFSRDLNFVLKIIGVNYSGFQLDKKRNSTGAEDRLTEFYTPHLIKMVRDKFAIDFEYFGYSTKIPS